MTLISFAGLAWLVFICQFHIFSGYIWQFMAISAYFCLLLAISTFYLFFDHVFLALIPSIHSTYHLPLLAINGIIFGLHYARYQESFFSLLHWQESLFTVCIHSSHLTALLLDPSDPALLALYSKKVDSGEKIKEMMLLFFFIYKKSDQSANNVSSNSLFLSSTNSCTSTWSRTAGKGKSVLNFESSCFPGIRQKGMTLPYRYVQGGFFTVPP